MNLPLYLRLLNRIDPYFLWTLYCYKAKRIFSRSYFILSFDCDTEDDIDVALSVHHKLQKIGITPVYAVPGELLKKGQNVYRKIYETGAEFINHGGCRHTYFDTLNQRHSSCFFYDQQSYQDLKNDIVLGHKTLKDVLGITAKGWRTPHFGTFQKPEHLKFLYKILKELNYTFSTSTSPWLSYHKSPLYKTNEIFEIPVTAIYSEPFNIMDTWAYFAAPDRERFPEEYLQSAQKISQFSKRYPMLINIYGDPSHIHDKSEFFEAMNLLVNSAQNTNYTKILKSFI